jgi:hypothetical protein
MSFYAHCENCQSETLFEELTFDYPATHCNFGNSGIHHTGEFECRDCGSEYKESDK